MQELKNVYRILCIDDNKNNLFTLNALLQSLENVDVVEALSAKDGLDVLLKKSIDLMLCDVQMPDINGFEFAKMVKSNKRTKEIPIIFVTAVFKSEEFVKEGFILGAVDYITKPIDDNQLLNKIRLYLKLFKEKQRVQRSEKLFHDIAQSIGDGIYTIDENLNATYINAEALELLGFQKEELLGKQIHHYIHYKGRDNKPIAQKDCDVHTTMIYNKSYKNEDEYLVKKDGSFLPVSITATPLYSNNEIVGTVAVFKDKSEAQKITSLQKERRKNQEQIIHSMIDMIESRDSYTAGHTKRVAKYCTMIAKEMDYELKEVALLEQAAWLHDIGKISTPDNVLLKPNKLNKAEYELIQEHLTTGYDMLSKIDQYKNIADIMREHHEKYDGSGYPRGLKGEEINPLSRIMMVADAFDAMTTNRVYKSKKTVGIALEELKSLSAIHFHPEVVQAAQKSLKDLRLDTDISQLPQTTMEEHRFSYFYKDRLTNLFVVEYLSLILRYYIRSNSLYMYTINLHHFSQYNQENGWEKGDAFLITFADYLKNLNKKSIVFRIEGDDFLILSEKIIDDIDTKLNSFSLLEESKVSLSVVKEYILDVHKKFNIE